MDMNVEKEILDDDALIKREYDALIQDYLNSNHRRKVEVIDKAFNLANEAHKGARRRSGEPYILHPIAVARIVCSEIGMGSTSICAALLHDVVEDTEYTVEDIKALFGDKIASIVDGLTKISSGMFGENVSSQAENFRKLLLTMSEDIRVILVKIADRLHNMRTLGSMIPAKQYKIAGETMYIYAPLAHRLGLFAIKTELEELSFKYENPEEYEAIASKLKSTFGQRKDLYNHFVDPLREPLDTLNLKYEIRAREKSIYSVWNKMRKKNVPFEEVYDIFAVRIIFESDPNFDEKKRCWDIYSVITDIYKLRPDRIRDWVSSPKSNGYQALHLTVMGPDGEWIEVQIRSRRMDEIAEKGFAAHWKYKEENVEEDNELEKWLKTVQEVLENPNPNAIDFLDTIKLNLFAQEIFVFTPKGDLKTLAQGATALDFAYALHSNIGDQCIGAKVNHKLVPLNEVLKSGDQVEILTSKSQEPKAEWLEIVTTAKAKSRIEYSLRKLKKEKIALGKTRLTNLLKAADIELTKESISKILDYYGIDSEDELFFAVGNKDVAIPKNALQFKNAKSKKKDNTSNFLVRYLKQAINKKPSKSDEIAPILPNAPIDRKKTYILQEEGFKKNFEVPSCCKPIPGDKVFGFVTDKNNVEIHTMACPVGTKLKANFGDKIVTVEWGKYFKFSFLAIIEMKGIDRVGILNELTQVTMKHEVEIKSLHIDSYDGIFEGSLSISVHTASDVNKLCKELKKIEGVSSVHRVN